MRVQLLSLVFIVGILSTGYATTLPGVSTAIKEEFLVAIKDNVLPDFLSQLKNVSFPAISFSSGSWIFKETYTISDVKLTQLSVNPDAATIALKAPNTISVNVPNASIEADFHYNTHGAFGESGNGSLSISGTTMSFSIAVGNSNGEPTASISSANVDMGDLSVDISSGWILKVLKFFVNTFSSLFKGIFEKQINSAIVSKGNAALSKALAGFPVNEPIPDTPLAIDYSLVDGPTVASDNIEVSVKGEIYNTKGSNALPIGPPAKMPAYLASGLDLQIFVSNYTINSVLYSATESGVASISIDQTMIPAKIPVKLNTNTFDAIFPGLIAAYGDDKPCTLQIALANPPSKVLIDESGMTLATDTNINLLVGSVVALELVALTDFNGDITVTGAKMFPTLTDAAIQSMTVTKSTVPKFNEKEAMQNLNDLIGTVKIAVDAIVFSQGVRLPIVDGIDLTDSKVTFGAGYFSIQSSPDFSGLVDDLVSGAMEGIMSDIDEFASKPIVFEEPFEMDESDLQELFPNIEPAVDDEPEIAMDATFLGDIMN
eukprot:CAMPEP_0115019386 /NCGR_PEP_ID=MMETSP0216-20121206/29413_1 /TAXON_ID=223996 /ORGANISM="Protocruzia adherens, Strain Boccale" /LENGTH=543 /DNA_ID=CAMNT_0002390847 /DNA_START=33 /DNA_END=1667 /DNA_ORIENTATION=-